MEKIMKFGGTSIADGEKIKHVVKLIQEEVKLGNTIVVVVSALASITDSLIQAIDKAKLSDFQFIKEFHESLSKRHYEVAKTAISNEKILSDVIKELNQKLSDLDKILTGIAYLGEVTPRSYDYVLSFGERLSAPIVSGALNNVGIKSKSLTGGEAGIVTDSCFGEARPLMSITTQQVKERLEPLLKRGIVPVVTGFIACTPEGYITTLGRGGSDYTATILGAALEVDEVWIWSDVDGLMTADPKIEPKAKTIETISFSEAIEIAYFGAKVIHPRALEPTAEKGIPVRIKNTFNPKNPGTLIIKEQRIKKGDIVKAITIIRDVAAITVSGAGMVGALGVAAKVFGILGENNVNVLMISQSSSEANISFIVPRAMLEKAVNALELSLLGGGLIKEIVPESDVCIIAVVGAGMKGTPGVAARVFQAVAREGINIMMIAQGSSELNISFVVKEKDGDKAVRAIHREFNLG
jgi:aspartate kinase